MKIAAVIAKILAALATVVGAIYLLATYGEQIVAWCKKVWNAMPKCPCCEEAEPAAEEAAVEEAVAEEPAAEEAPAQEEPVAEEVVVEETAPVAEEADFAE